MYWVKSGSTEADDLYRSLLVCVGFLCLKVIVKQECENVVTEFVPRGRVTCGKQGNSSTFLGVLYQSS